MTITSSISEGEIVCPGETVTFTCVTRGTIILIWSSEEYIGAINIDFNERDNINRPVQASRNNNTLATLVNVSMDGSTRVLVSQLRIIVSSVSLTPSVTCINELDRTSDTIPFRVPGI